MSLSPPCPAGGLYKASEAQIQASWTRTTNNSDYIYVDSMLVKSRVENPSLGLSGKSETVYTD